MRNWGLISELSRRHTVDVLSFLDPGQSAHAIEATAARVDAVDAVEAPARSLRQRLWELVTTSLPDMALRLASAEYADRLASRLEEAAFDVVHVEGIEMAPYISTILRASQVPRIVFDDHNCEYLLQERAFQTDARIPRRWPLAAYSMIQWRRLRRFEARACRWADRVIAVSQADAAALERLVPGLDVLVVSNGIDTDAYHPPPPRPQATAATVVFTGTMDFRPNVDAVLWFAREVLPLIQLEIPDVHFTIVGQRPHRRLHALRSNPAITITGWVEDPRPFIAEATVYVVPLRVGGGTRLKLLEAMAMARPVVSTRLGAEGYPVHHERELLLADLPQDFADAVLTLLHSPSVCREIGSRARSFVETTYDWRVVVPCLEQAYES